MRKLSVLIFLSADSRKSIEMKKNPRYHLADIMVPGDMRCAYAAVYLQDGLLEFFYGNTFDEG